MSLPAVNLGYPITMFTMTLKEIQDATNATIVGAISESECIVRGINTDSRTVKPGELFVVLKGDNFDAHDFVTHAADRGAAAFLVEREITDVKPVLVVKNTRIAFGQLAKVWRSQFTYPVVAVTGSNGKTTVKEMLHSVLSTQGNVLATKGNFNNDIGVPVTLYRMTSKHDSAVIEMGANHKSEISYLTELVQPDVAIITNAAAAHLDGFGSLDGVAEAKGEIFEGLADDGVAILNYDDPHYKYWQQLVGSKKILSFGSDHKADVSFYFKDKALIIKIKDSDSFELKLALLGRHNIINALAAIAASIALNIDFKFVKQGLESMKPVPGRLIKRHGINNSIVIDDTYNANPASLAAALEAMSCFTGTYHVVLGDMAELGEDSIALHKKAAHLIKEGKAKYLYTIGEKSQYTSEAFGKGATHFHSHSELLEQLSKKIKPNDVVLVKGSRSMQMEKIVDSICSLAPEPDQEGA